LIAVSLTDNGPYLTAVANDAGYENVFVEQMRGIFHDGDILMAISASGNSENTLRAVQYANAKGGISIGLVGFDGGKMKSECQITLHIETQPGEYGPVEDVHHSICHIVTTFLKLRAQNC
jgi:D-sedoheptulose 7-phosphate isomerase